MSNIISVKRGNFMWHADVIQCAHTRRPMKTQDDANSNGTYERRTFSITSALLSML